MTPGTAHASEDVVTFIVEDHRRIAGLLALLRACDPLERPLVLRAAADVLSSHETAEELVLYPALRAEAPDGEAISDRALVGQSELSELLAALESVAWWSEERFVAVLEDLDSTFASHVAWEETVPIALLECLVSPPRRVALGARYLEVNAAGPTLAARALRRAMARPEPIASPMRTAAAHRPRPDQKEQP